MIRVGVLGCSDIARRKFIPALLKSEQARLVALASRQRDTAAALADGLRLELLTYQELVSDPAIDLIYISLPNQLHEEWSIRALEQGKHVICEKPLGLNATSVKRMLAAAGRQGRLLYENIMYLQHPQHSAVKALLASGRIGRILMLTTEFAFPGPPEGDFRLNPGMGGGAFHDMNRYPLSAARFFLAGQSHHFITGTIEERDGLTMALQAESITDAGERFSFLTAFGRSYRSFYEIVAERGSIRVERAYTTPADRANRIVVMANGRDVSFTAPQSDHFLNTIERVCGLIRDGQWEGEYQRALELAALADMFHGNYMRKGAGHAN